MYLERGIKGGHVSLTPSPPSLWDGAQAEEVQDRIPDPGLGPLLPKCNGSTDKRNVHQPGELEKPR